MPRGKPKQLPTLTTARLVLRALRAGDAAAISTGAGDPEVARFLLQTPTPYPRELARAWIDHRASWWPQRGATFALALAEAPAALVGTASLHVVARDRRAELGYWLARGAWGQGLATEAVRAVIAFGFETLGLARIHAAVLDGNAPSERVLAKVGMQREGVQRGHVRKDGTQRDLTIYGVLADDARAR